MKATDKWKKLREGNICGIVDSYGAVHSVLTETVEFHADHFPLSHCQWRWDFDESINWISIERRPSEEQYEAIRTHLTKKYGIKWWDNGYHDIDHILTKCGKVQNEFGVWVDKA
jgi:hypothetical protein